MDDRKCQKRDLDNPCVDKINSPTSRCLEQISDLTSVLISHYEIYRCLMGVVSSLGIFVVHVWRCGCQPFKYLLKRNIHMRKQRHVNPKALGIPVSIFGGLVSRINQHYRTCVLAYTHGWGHNYQVDIYEPVVRPLQIAVYRGIVG